MKKCTFTKTNGNPCQANSITNSEFCFSHDPNMSEQKRLATQKGGKAIRKAADPLSSLEINDTKDVVKLLSTTINEVRLGTAEIRVANCIGYLSGHLLKALEVANLEERITQIEKIILKT